MVGTSPADIGLVLPAEPPKGRIRSGTLVGRGQELAMLMSALQRRATSHPAVVVGGPAGIGKSAVLDHFLATARKEGATVLRGSCVEVESRRAFGAFAELLVSASRTVGTVMLDRAIRSHGVELSRLIAAPGNAFARVAIDDQNERHRMHGSFLGVLEALGRDHALVVAIEDLQWADAASVELFGYLARRLRERPVLLVGTYRTDEPRGQDSSLIALADLAAARVVERIELAPLDIADAGALIRSALRLRSRQPRAFNTFRAAVHDRCEGSPLFIEETLETLVRSGALTYRDGAWIGDLHSVAIAVPRSIADTVTSRVARLSTAARHLLAAGSVIGHRIDHDLLMATSGLAESDMIAGLHEAIDAQVLTADETGGYAFRHALTREAVRSLLLQPERRALHAKVGQALEERADTLPVSAEELAYQFEQAGDADRARRYSERAAEESSHAFAFARAADHLERAIAYARPEDPALGELTLRLVGHAVAAGEGGRAARAATAARDIFEHQGNVEGLARALLAGASAHGAVSSNEERLRSAIGLLEPIGPSRTLAHAYIAESWRLLRSGDSVLARSWAERGLSMARELGAVREEVWALNRAGVGAFHDGETNDGLAYLGKAIDLGQTIGSDDRGPLTPLIAGAMSNLVILSAISGAPREELRARRDELRAFVRSHGIRTATATWRELTWLFADGDWDEFLTLRSDIDDDATFEAAEMELRATFISVARDGPQASGTEPERARVQLVEAGFGRSAFFWMTAIHLLRGDAQGVLKNVQEPIGRFDAMMEEQAFEGAALLCGIQATLVVNDEKARSRLIRALLETDSKGTPERANRAFALAEQAIGAAALDDAIGLLRESIDLYKAGDCSFTAGVIPKTLAHLRRAEVFLRRGGVRSKEAANAEFGAAVDFWKRAGAKWYLGVLRTWARERGLSVMSVAGAAKTSLRELTTRERDVALLVAEGLTNREIAERLTLSARTAESHVERIRSKLGFRTRAQIAAWATETFGRNSP